MGCFRHFNAERAVLNSGVRGVNRPPWLNSVVVMLLLLLYLCVEVVKKSKFSVCGER